MMLLQASEPVQIGVGLLTVANTAMLMRLSFSAGSWVEKVLQLERRVAHLEDDKGCGAEDCPLHKND